jgi:hypothetical protein
MKRIVLAVMLAAPAAFAQSVAMTSSGVVVAHDGVIERQGAWSVAGVQNPGPIVVGRTQIAVLDAVENVAVVVDLERGRATRLDTAETPVDGLFVGRDLYVIARDARTLQRFAPDGSGESVATGADPAYLREANGRIYVYARVGGLLHEIEPARMRIAREVKVAPFASDMEIDAKNVYLVHPRAAKMQVVTLATMEAGGEISVGGVPVDVTLAADETLATGQTLAVADPSSKRVWIVEGVQSLAAAFARGVVRGLVGMRVFSNDSKQFPTGVDRVFIRGKRWIAYDSASRTLYRVDSSKSTAKSTVIATGVAPNSFALTRDGVTWWDDAVRRLQKIAF